MRKQKGFSLIELLIVVAIILIIAAIAIPNLMSARRSANESAGASTVRTLNTAEVTYSTTYPTAGYAPDLTHLGPSSDCTTPSTITSANACLVDNVLACGSAKCNKSAYQYSIVSTTTTPPVPDYVISAMSLGTALARKDFCSIPDAVARTNATPSSGTPAAAPTMGACIATPWSALAN